MVVMTRETVWSDVERRRELADFLRTRRARLTPAAVGLPTGMRRRTPGLRREEVAQLAGIGTTWYTRLEQEWDIRVSSTALAGIARALRLSAEERRHLYLLAEQPPPPPPPPLEETISPAIQLFIDSLGHLPAQVLGRRYDLVAANDAARRIFPQVEVPPYPRNFVWRLFTDLSHRNGFAHGDAVAQKVVEEFRADSARYPGDPAFTELIEDLRRVSPEFRELWSRHDVRGIYDGPKEFVHPVVGLLVLQQTTLHLPSNPDLKLMIYVPLPEADTEAKLRQLLAPIPDAILT